MELSPDLTPSFQLYISLQIGSKDASFPVPVAPSLHCDRCMCVGRGEGEREREGEGGERESVYVRVLIDSSLSAPAPPPLLYTLCLGLMIRSGACV